MPIAGDRKRGRDIGVKSKTEGSRWYIWTMCPECLKSRWVQERETFKPRYTGGICLSCIARRKGEKNRNWKGGIKQAHGYILIKKPDHPRASSQGYVREHILVWEQSTGKLLPDGWVIHHFNGIKNDNRSVNLLAMPNKKHGLFISSLQKRIFELEAKFKNQGVLL